MLPKLFSLLGLACIAAALAGFVLPRSVTTVATQSQPDQLAFNEGDAGGPQPSPTPTGTTPTPSPSASPTAANTNGTITNANTSSTNGNTRPTPQPTRTPTPQPPPSPTPRPSPSPSPRPTPDTRALFERNRPRYVALAKARGDLFGGGESDGPVWLSVRRALDSDKDTKGVSVSVSGGWVTLFGTVRDDAARGRAVSLAREAVGDKAKVFDKLTVETKPRNHLSPPARRGFVVKPGADDDEELIGADGGAARSGNADPGAARGGSQVAYVKTQSPVSETSTLEIEYPRELKKNDTGVVRVTIIRQQNGAATPAPTTDIPTNATVQAAAEHCNTPHTGLRNAYGPQYEATATAKLDSSSFDVRAANDAPQTLDPSRVTWQWSITPRSAGSGAVNLAVAVQWTRRGTNQTKPSCKILDRSLAIRVTDSFLSDANLTKAQVVLGLVGTFLQLPIFIWRRKDDKKGDDK